PAGGAMPSPARGGIKTRVGLISTRSRFFSFVCGAWALSACGFSTLEGLAGGSGDAGGDVVDAGRDRSSGATDGGRGDASRDVASDTPRLAADTGASVDVASEEVIAGCDGGCPGNGYCAGGAEPSCAYPSCIARLLSQPKSASGVYLVDPDGAGGA